jgi:hypothetical protein
MPPWAQDLALRLAALLGFLFLAALIGGSAWIAWEYWDAGERTELLGIEVRWLRLFWLACAVIGGLAILAPAFARNSRRAGDPPPGGGH